MLGRQIAAALLALSVVAVDGCSLAVDVSDIDQGRNCAPGEKFCGHCVDIHNPAYGCTKTNCEPCELTNAIPDCGGETQETCVVKACLYGFSCQSNLSGCPKNILLDRDNCGECGQKCPAGYGCFDGQCLP